MRLARRARIGTVRLHAADPGADCRKMVQRRPMSSISAPPTSPAISPARYWRGRRGGAYRGNPDVACDDGARHALVLCLFRPGVVLWFFVWRFLAGLAGGVIMVLAASMVLPHTSPAKRGIVGGVIFAGVGLGIAASGTLVPLLLQQGLRESLVWPWGLSGLLTLISWTSWPKEGQPAAIALRFASPIAAAVNQTPSGRCCSNTA